MLEVHAILQRQRCNENITKKTGTLSDAYGDEVYYTSRYYSKILKVDRVTSTTIVCGSEKFRKQNGRQIPADTWGSSYISVLTESLKNQYYEMIRKKQLITKIKSVDLFQLSVDSLQQISDVIQNSMTE